MSTIERLKVLYKERYREFEDIDDWNDAIEAEWPKLLAVVEAAKFVTVGGRDHNIDDLRNALAALDGVSE